MEGMPRAWLNRPMTPMAVPSASNAERIGRMAAKIEPKTSSKTIKASSTPRPVLLKDWLLACSASGPVTATVSPSPEVFVTASTKFLASALEMFWVCLSKLTWKKPTVWSLLMVGLSVGLVRFPLWSNGLVTGVTLGSALILSTMALMRWPMAGSVSLFSPEVPKTTCSVSPEWDGATDLRRLMASKDCVWGKLKLFE